MVGIFDVLNQGWIGALLGAVGIVFGIYQVRRRTGARLNYQYAGQRLIESGGGLLSDSVAVVYDGMEIPRVSLTQIVIWNAGHAPVRGQDVIPEHPIRFAFRPETEILEAEIIKCARTANASSVSVESHSRNMLSYKFSFLDRDDGALIRVLHTGKRTKPTCEGTVVGVPNGVEFAGRIPVFPSHSRYQPAEDAPPFARALADAANKLFRFRKIFFFFMLIVSLALIFLAVFPQLVHSSDNPFDTKDRILSAVFGVIYGLPAFTFLWMERRRFPVSLLPDELSNDRDDEEIDGLPRENA